MCYHTMIGSAAQLEYHTAMPQCTLHQHAHRVSWLLLGHIGWHFDSPVSTKHHCTTYLCIVVAAMYTIQPAAPDTHKAMSDFELSTMDDEQQQNMRSGIRVRSQSTPVSSILDTQTSLQLQYYTTVCAVLLCWCSRVTQLTTNEQQASASEGPGAR